MANQVRLTVLQPEGTDSGIDWIKKVTDAISRLLTVQEKIVEVVQFQRNYVWSKTLGDMGYLPKPFSGALSIYSSDVDSLKELISTVLKEEEFKNSPPVWVVGYDEVKVNRAPKDPSKPLAKFVGLLQRNPNLTSPQFHSHWTGPHASLFLSVPVIQQKVVIYTQFHSSPELTEEFAKMGLNIATYEGIVEIWFETIEDLVEVFASPEQANEILADDAIFMNLEESGVLIGVDAVEAKKHTATS